MIELRSVDEVRAAEDAARALLPDGALMQRAAHALALACADLLVAVRGRTVGSRVVLLIGSGDNGGDALWAGALLAGRGCRVDAIHSSDRVHAEGAAALRRAGGRAHPVDAAPALLGDADLVIDGLLGIGGRGGLRPPAAALAEAARAVDAVVVAVDLPSGVDADTGAVAGAAVGADVTVTFGAVKPGLVVAPGSLHSGTVRLVDIGLEFSGRPLARVIEALDVASWVGEPAADAYKYRRGVVGVCAGSAAYPGAALLATSSARRANVGMARFLDRADGCATMVVAAYPDVVVDGSAPQSQDRVDAWACGPGFPGDERDAQAVGAVLAAAVPVVLDAGALAVLADDPGLRDAVLRRQASGLVTVVTPHDGEFARLVPGLLAESAGRLDAAAAAAARLGAIVVLKGPGTIIAPPSGAAWVDTEGTADLGTAGSGDVLAGIIAALLAGAWAEGRRSIDELAEAAAAAVWLHGAAGRIAARSGPVTATDVSDALPAAIRLARFGTLRAAP